MQMSAALISSKDRDRVCTCPHAYTYRSLSHGLKIIDEIFKVRNDWIHIQFFCVHECKQLIADCDELRLFFGEHVVCVVQPELRCITARLKLAARRSRACAAMNK